MHNNFNRIILLCTIVIHLFLPSLFCKSADYKEEIRPYVSFLQEQKKTPKDYIINLFSKYNIVILCERFHGEITQYDMIYDLISDRRFIDTVGNIFTESGTSSNNLLLHDFLFAESLSEKQIEAQALYIYRHFFWGPFWEKRNIFEFLKKLYQLNSTLSFDRKINLFFSDMPFSWEGMTKEKYQDFLKTLNNRDKIMAQQIITKFREIINSDQKRKKALVIMNYRHAFNDFIFSDGKKGDNTGRYLFEEFKDQGANVMVNSVTSLPGSTDQQEVYAPIQNGKWDAAFEIAGNPNLGFDFNGSPFGEDDFDYFPFRKNAQKYKNVFTGYIFYKPLQEHKMVIGIPHLFDDGYDKIILDRMAISGMPIKEDEIKSFILDWENVREFTYEVFDIEYKTKINSWLLRNNNP